MSWRMQLVGARSHPTIAQSALPTGIKCCGVEGSDLKTVRLPFRSPNLNARAERFVRSIKKKCLDRIMLYSKRTLRHTVKNFVEHYHSERNPQGLGNRIIESDEWVGGAEGQVSCRERLGGLLKHYHRRAA